MIIMIGILIVVMAAIGMPLSGIIKASKLPAWAKANPATPWGIVWFDDKQWLKQGLIKIGQTLLVVALFFINFFWHLIKAASSAFVKVLEGGVKKVTAKK